MLCLWNQNAARRIRTLCLAFAALMLLTSGPALAQGAVSRAELREDLFRFTGRYIDQIAEGYDALRDRTTQARLRRLAQDNKMAAAENTIRISTGPHPDVNLMDMLVLVSLQRLAMEEHWIPREFGKKNGAPMAPVLRGLEAEIWAIARKVMSAQQQEELRRLIRAWRQKHPKDVYVEGTRFGDFSNEFAQSALADAGSPGFLLPEVGAAGEAVEDLRLLGERLMFYLQYVPALTRAQADLVALDILSQLETQKLLANADAITEQVKQFNATLEGMPDQIAARQIQVVDHAVARLTEQQKEILGELEKGGQQMRGLLGELRQTAKDGQVLAAQIDTTVDKINILVEPTDVADPFTPTKLSQLLVQASQVAERTEQAAEAAQNLLASAPTEGTASTLLALFERLDREAEGWLDQIFWRVLILLVVMLIAAPTSVFAYRYAANRFLGPGAQA